jgi:hypothetical protein
MAQRDETKRGSHRHIGVGDAVDGQRREKTFITAIEHLESAVGEMPMTVIDRIAAGVRGDE